MLPLVPFALKRGDQFLGTDHPSFDTESGNYIAEGNVRYQDSSIRMVAKRAEGNQEADTHKISDIQYQLVSRRGNGGAESIDLQGAVGQMHRSTYTTCDPSQPIWKLSAPQIEVDNDEGFGTARNAVLRIGKVPVLWAPYFKFPIDDRRQTGLLYPQLGMSGRNGFDYAQPIYFNLAPNYDDTLTLNKLLNGFDVDGIHGTYIPASPTCVGYLDHAHIRFDCTKGIVFCSNASLGERVEQGGFTDVGKANDAAFESHENSLSA
mgnify:CR=1 FL=1